MKFYITYLSISGIIVLSLFIRTIWVIVNAWKNRSGSRSEISELRDFLNATRNFQNEIDRANATMQQLVTMHGSEQVFERTPVINLETQERRRKKGLMAYPFKNLSRGEDSTSYEMEIGENYATILWKMSGPKLGESAKSYLENLIVACKDVHLEHFYYDIAMENESSFPNKY